MNCYQQPKKIDSFYQYQYYDEPLQYQNHEQQPITYQYTQNYDMNLNPTDLQIDVESFVANLPSLEELDSIEHQQQQQQQQPNNQYVYHTELVTMSDQPQYQAYTQNDIPISKVEILNQILHTASNSSNSNFSNLSSSYSSFSSTSNSSIEQYNYESNQTPKKRTLKCKIKRKDEKHCCNVCGYKSSGFHYGSHTCEACKLFFRRAEKQIRKTGFNQCQTKNCLINYENRAICSECRYKKCIAVGMAMSRSRYGRHTTQLGSNYAPNLTESLCLLVENLKQICLRSTVDLGKLNNLIVEFYYKTIKLLTSNNTNNEQTTNLEFSLNVDSPLSELSYLITQTKPNATKVKLPDCVLILFCVLFDIKITSPDLQLQTMIDDFNKFLHETERKILKTNQFVLMLKVGLYFKALHRLLTQNNFSNYKEDPFDKRITDLMRSEFAMFKFDLNDTSEFSYNQTLLSPSSSSCSSSSIASQQNDMPPLLSLSSLFGEISQLIYKNMTFEEFNQFMLQSFEFD